MRRTDGSFAEQLEQDWYLPRLTPLTSALRSLAVVFGGLAWLRRMAYRAGLLRSQRVGVPVVIVGNITVGGTGKTPLVVWLSEALRAAGLKPGIVLRGYRAVIARGVPMPAPCARCAPIRMRRASATKPFCSPDVPVFRFSPGATGRRRQGPCAKPTPRWT